MKRQLLFWMFVIIATENITGQVPSKIIGEWHVYEMTTDRFYKNFVSDSICLFSSEDQGKYKTDEVKSALAQVFQLFSGSSLTIEKNNTIIFNLPGLNPEKEKFTFNSKLSLLSIGSSHKLDTMKLTQDKLLVFVLSDEYEKKIFTFRRKSN